MAITTVAKLNIYLGETSLSDAKTNAVAAAISFVQSYCGRTFDSTRWRKWRYIEACDRLILEDRPIISLNRIALGTRNAISIAFSHATATSANIAVLEDRLQISTSAAGVVTQENILWGILAEQTTKISGITTALLAVVTSLDTWSTTCLVDDESYALKPTPPQDVLNTTIWLDCPEKSIGGSGLDIDAGIVYLPYQATGWVYADYNAGYGSIPAALEQVTTEIAAAILKSSTVSGAVQSERIGDYQYTAAQGGTFALGILSSYESRLDLYRKVRL